MAILNETCLKAASAYTVLLYWVYCSFPRSPNDLAARPDNSKWSRVSISAVKQISVSLSLIILCTVAAEQSSEKQLPKEVTNLWNTSNSAVPCVNLLLSALCRLRLMICSVGLFYFKQHTCSARKAGVLSSWLCGDKRWFIPDIYWWFLGLFIFCVFIKEIIVKCLSSA